jgi:acetate kinase
MGTRCGALDPGVILYLMPQHGMDHAATEDLIYRKSGLLVISAENPRIPVLVIATNEELMIVRHTISILVRGGEA